MIIVGAKGFAKEVLEILHHLNKTDFLAFFDDINEDIGKFLFNKFPILRSEEQVKAYFIEHGNEFILGVGNPMIRKKLCQKFLSFGGKLISSVSPSASIGSFDVEIGDGTNILSNAIFSNGTKIGRGGLVYYNVLVTHDVTIGEFVELSPGVTLLGRVTVGNYTSIGSNATVLPDVTIGNNVVVGAGSIVTTDIPDNKVVVGVPARVIKTINANE